MQIKPYNRVVDPNTVQGHVQAPADMAAYGGNQQGTDRMIQGLGEVNKQVQAFMDDQINLGVVDATNKYEDGLNKLLYDPDNGLMHKEDMNAMDVMKQYSDAEAQLRKEAISSLPGYQKAHDAFYNTASTVNRSKLGAVMQYQYQKSEEKRADTLQTGLSNGIDRQIESNDINGVFAGFNQNMALVYSLYGGKYGKDKLDEMVKDANTKLALAAIQNNIVQGDESSYDTALAALDKMSPFVDDSKLGPVKQVLFARRRDNEKNNLAKKLYDMFKGDPVKTRKWLEDNNTTTVAGGNNLVSIVDKAAAASGISQDVARRIAAVETGGGKLKDINMAGNGGLFQIEGKTAQYYGIDKKYPNWQTDAEQNAAAAMEVLKHKIDENGGDVNKGIAAYNGGGDPDYMTKIGNADIAYDGGNGELHNNLVTQFSRWDGVTPENGRVGCAEAVGNIGSGYSEFLKNERQNNVFSVPKMVEDAKKENSGVMVTDWDPKNVNEGDCILYRTGEGDYGHIMIADGNGGAYGNLSSGNNGQGAISHVSDYNLSGMQPMGIIKTGAQAGGKTVTKYSSDEITQIINKVQTLQSESVTAENLANNALVKQGLDEMAKLYHSGTTDPAAFQAIAEKYGYNNPKVYASLKGSIGLYAMSVRASAGGGTRGGGSGGGRSSASMLKSSIGPDGFHSFGEITEYCNDHGIALSFTDAQSLQKACEDYQNGRGEWKPEYSVDKEDVARVLGTTTDTLSGDWQSTAEIGRQQAIKFREKNGRDPSYNELVQLYSYGAMENNGTTQAAMRSAGIQQMDNTDDPNYKTVTYRNGDQRDVYVGDVNSMLEGTETRADIGD